MTGSHTHAIHVRQKPCVHGLADADIVSAFPLSFSTFQENINTLRQTSQHDIPSAVGVLHFEKLRGSMENKFPCRYFWGQVKNKNETIWVYSEKFACQILNFFKMSISEPFFFL